MGFGTGAICDVNESESQPHLISFYIDKLSTNENMRDTPTVGAVPNNDVSMPVSSAQNGCGIVLLNYSVSNADRDVMEDQPILRAFATEWDDGRLDTVSIDEKTPLIQSAHYIPRRIDPNNNNNENSEQQMNSVTQEATKSYPSAEAAPPPLEVDSRNNKRNTPTRDTDMRESIILTDRGEYTVPPPFTSGLSRDRNERPYKTSTLDVSPIFTPSQPSLHQHKRYWDESKVLSKASPLGYSETIGSKYPTSHTLQKKPFKQTESLESLQREIAASRNRLKQVRSLLQEHPSSSSADSVKRNNTFTSPSKREDVSGVAFTTNDALAGGVASSSTTFQKSPYTNMNELNDSSNYFSANSRILDALRREMQQGTLLSAPRATGHKLREAWRRDPTLPEHLHHVADIEGVGLVRLSRLITVLRAHDFLDWTEMEVARICAFLASQPTDEDEHIERGIQNLEKSMTHIVIREEDGIFYLNGGAFFALLRALLMM